MHFIVQKQIDVAKKLNCALLEKIQYLLSNAQLDKSFWAEALIYSSYLMNRLSSSAIVGKTLLKIWLGGVAQGYDLLRIFGYPIYFCIKKDKLDPQTKKSVFFGIKINLKGYKLLDSKNKKFILSKYVTFDEA